MTIDYAPFIRAKKNGAKWKYSAKTAPKKEESPPTPAEEKHTDTKTSQDEAKPKTSTAGKPPAKSLPVNDGTTPMPTERERIIGDEKARATVNELPIGEDKKGNPKMAPKSGAGHRDENYDPQEQAARIRVASGTAPSPVGEDDVDPENQIQYEQARGGRSWLNSVIARFLDPNFGLSRLMDPKSKDLVPEVLRTNFDVGDGPHADKVGGDEAWHPLGTGARNMGYGLTLPYLPAEVRNLRKRDKTEYARPTSNAFGVAALAALGMGGNQIEGLDPTVIPEYADMLGLTPDQGVYGENTNGGDIFGIWFRGIMNRLGIDPDERIEQLQTPVRRALLLAQLSRIEDSDPNAKAFMDFMREQNQARQDAWRMNKPDLEQAARDSIEAKFQEGFTPGDVALPQINGRGDLEDILYAALVGRTRDNQFEIGPSIRRIVLDDIFRSEPGLPVSLEKLQETRDNYRAIRSMLNDRDTQMRFMPEILKRRIPILQRQAERSGSPVMMQYVTKLNDVAQRLEQGGQLTDEDNMLLERWNLSPSAWNLLKHLLGSEESANNFWDVLRMDDPDDNLTLESYFMPHDEYMQSNQVNAARKQVGDWARGIIGKLQNGEQLTKEDLDWIDRLGFNYEDYLQDEDDVRDAHIDAFANEYIDDIYSEDLPKSQRGLYLRNFVNSLKGELDDTLNGHNAMYNKYKGMSPSAWDILAYLRHRATRDSLKKKWSEYPLDEAGMRDVRNLNRDEGKWSWMDDDITNMFQYVKDNKQIPEEYADVLEKMGYLRTVDPMAARPYSSFNRVLQSIHPNDGASFDSSIKRTSRTVLNALVSIQDILDSGVELDSDTSSKLLHAQEVLSRYVEKNGADKDFGSDIGEVNRQLSIANSTAKKYNGTAFKTLGLPVFGDDFTTHVDPLEENYGDIFRYMDSGERAMTRPQTYATAVMYYDKAKSEMAHRDELQKIVDKYEDIINSDRMNGYEPDRGDVEALTDAMTQLQYSEKKIAKYIRKLEYADSSVGYDINASQIDEDAITEAANEKEEEMVSADSDPDHDNEVDEKKARFEQKLEEVYNQDPKVFAKNIILAYAKKMLSKAQPGEDLPTRVQKWPEPDPSAVARWWKMIRNPSLAADASPARLLTADEVSQEEYDNFLDAGFDPDEAVWSIFPMFKPVDDEDFEEAKRILGSSPINPPKPKEDDPEKLKKWKDMAAARKIQDHKARAYEGILATLAKKRGERSSAENAVRFKNWYNDELMPKIDAENPNKGKFDEELATRETPVDWDAIKNFADAYLAELGFPVGADGVGLPYLETNIDPDTGELISSKEAKQRGIPPKSTKVLPGDKSHTETVPVIRPDRGMRYRTVVDQTDPIHNQAVADWRDVLQQLMLMKGRGMSDKEAINAIIDSDAAEKIPYRILEMLKNETFYKGMYAILPPIILRTLRGGEVRMTPFLKARRA